MKQSSMPILFLFGLLISVGLLELTNVVSHVVRLNLSGFIILGSSLWAAWDSSKIGLKKYKSGISYGPIVLFFGCLALWIAAFPWYLAIRCKIQDGTAQLKGDEPARSFDKIIITSVIALVIGLPIVGITLFVQNCPIIVVSCLPSIKQKITFLSAVITLNPFNSKAYILRGMFNEGQGQYEKAIDDYNQAIRWNANDAKPKTMLANATMYFNEWRQTIAECTKTLELNPNDLEAYENRASALVGLGQYKKAIDDCDAAINLDPKDAHAYETRGSANIRLEQYQNAIDDYTKAINIHPDFNPNYLSRADAYDKIGKRDLAEQDRTKGNSLWQSKYGKSTKTIH